MIAKTSVRHLNGECEEDCMDDLVRCGECKGDYCPGHDYTGFCTKCNDEFCTDCSEVFYCGDCEEGYCKTCTEFVYCESTGMLRCGDCRRTRCEECNGEAGFCFKCNKTCCVDCNEVFQCQDCQCGFCKSCVEVVDYNGTKICGKCNERKTIKECDVTISAKVAGKCGGCRGSDIEKDDNCGTDDVIWCNYCQSHNRHIEQDDDEYDECDDCDTETEPEIFECVDCGVEMNAKDYCAFVCECGPRCDDCRRDLSYVYCEVCLECTCENCEETERYCFDCVCGKLKCNGCRSVECDEKTIGRLREIDTEGLERMKAITEWANSVLGEGYQCAVEMTVYVCMEHFAVDSYRRSGRGHCKDILYSGWKNFELCTLKQREIFLDDIQFLIDNEKCRFSGNAICMRCGEESERQYPDENGQLEWFCSSCIEGLEMNGCDCGHCWDLDVAVCTYPVTYK